MINTFTADASHELEAKLRAEGQAVATERWEIVSKTAGKAIAILSLSTLRQNLAKEGRSKAFLAGFDYAVSRLVR